MTQNVKKNSEELYLMIAIFGTHVYNDISSNFFYFFKILIYSGF